MYNSLLYKILKLKINFIIPQTNYYQRFEHPFWVKKITALLNDYYMAPHTQVKNLRESSPEGVPGGKNTELNDGLRSGLNKTNKTVTAEKEDWPDTKVLSKIQLQ